METFATLIKFMTSINWGSAVEDLAWLWTMCHQWRMYEWHKHVWEWVRAKRGHFEHSVILKSTKMLMFRSKSMTMR